MLLFHTLPFQAGPVSKPAFYASQIIDYMLSDVDNLSDTRFSRHTWRASRATTTLGPLCNIERSQRPCIMRGSTFSWATPLCPLFALEALYKNCFRGANLLIDSYQESAPGKHVVCLLAGLCRLPRQFLPTKEHHSSECRPYYLNQFGPLFK